jgi:hypothetical protein
MPEMFYSTNESARLEHTDDFGDMVELTDCGAGVVINCKPQGSDEGAVSVSLPYEKLYRFITDANKRGSRR